MTFIRTAHSQTRTSPSNLEARARFERGACPVSPPPPRWRPSRRARALRALAHARARGVRRHVTLATADDAASSPAPALTRRDAVLGSAALSVLTAIPARAAEPLKESFYDYTVQQYGKPFDLGAFRGNVTVVLNVASE